MSTVSELRAEARSLEQAGAVAEALAVYDDLIIRAERAEETVDSLASLYEHVGDLRVRVRQPSRAFACYQKAADLHVVRGKTSAILELCVKMINVVPAAGDAYLRFARRLTEHRHTNAALGVLQEYATRARMETITQAVETVRVGEGLGRDQLERALDTLDTITQGHAAAARSVIEELEQSTEMVSLPASAESPPPSRRDKIGGRSKKNRAEPQLVKSSPPASPAASDTRSGKAATSPTRSAVPRSSRGWVLGAAVTVVSIALVVMIVRFQMGRGAADSTESAVAAVADPMPPSVEDSLESSEPLGDDAGDQAQPVAAATTSPSTAPAAPASPPTPSLTTGDSVNGDSTLVIDEPIVVNALAISTVTPASFRGQQGFRVVHLLDSVAEFVVESYPVDSASARSFPLGTVIVNVVQPDTSVSIVRFDERYLVFASGVVPEDSMRTLLGLLQIRGQ